jgi:hypothetical protein
VRGILEAFAQLGATARRAGAHPAAVHTQDQDFDGIPSIEVVRV